MRKNWDVIRDDYIQHPITHKEIAKKYGITDKTVSLHATKENWRELRAEYVRRTTLKTFDRQVDEAVSDRQRLIKSIENLVNLKIDAETRVLLKTCNINQVRLLATILSKSKNNIPDLTKVAELLKGNATERPELQESERTERLTRLRSRVSLLEGSAN